jgi:sec-independent protein translocase protein TatC
MTDDTPESADARMTLFEHLSELRSRLGKVTLAVLLLGVSSLVFSKWIYGLLMRPVLLALPTDASSLVYTSAIEELNVLMKVGLYCGVFLSTPVLLWQVWGFVSPGLYEQERHLAGPFVFVGTGAFLAGAAFCYFVVLPPMFQFLLRDPVAVALEQRLEGARLGEDDALRYLRLGEVKKAGDVAREALHALQAEGEGQVKSDAGLFDVSIVSKRHRELQERLEGLGRLIDATHDGLGPAARPVLLSVMEKQVAATRASALDEPQALILADEAAARLAGASAPDAAEFAHLWSLQKELAFGQARFEALHWTRPMLAMSQQLSLVLLLLLAFGVIFELPLVMAVLGMAGLLTSAFLMKYQRHAFVFCLILAAVLTPTGDAINLALMAGPMFLCFELGLLAVWVLEKRRARLA